MLITWHHTILLSPGITPHHHHPCPQKKVYTLTWWYMYQYIYRMVWISGVSIQCTCNLMLIAFTYQHHYFLTHYSTKINSQRETGSTCDATHHTGLPETYLQQTVQRNLPTMNKPTDVHQEDPRLFLPYNVLSYRYMSQARVFTNYTMECMIIQWVWYPFRSYNSRFKKLYCPFKNILKTKIFLQSHIKWQ